MADPGPASPSTNTTPVPPGLLPGYVFSKDPDVFEAEGEDEDGDGDGDGDYTSTTTTPSIMGALARRDSVLFQGGRSGVTTAPTVRGKLIPNQTRRLELGSRGGIVEVGKNGNRRYLKEYQRRQCLAGQLPGDVDGFCANLAARGATAPHGKPYGGFAHKDGTPLPPATKRRPWRWSRSKRRKTTPSS